MIVLTNTARLVQHKHHVHVGITHWREGERGKGRERRELIVILLLHY